jgi:mono/diheme cytochrome c family protein
MEYPILHWNFWGGGLLIALVATIHVFIAHFAVGGGLFIAVMETRVQRLGLVSLKDYLRRYARFFLVFTMVVGGLTGVGIWFSISIGAPAATSALIHGFVLGWATEWAFFLAEIVALLAYMRSFEAVKSRRRLVLAWLYFVFAWGSLAVVQGFISFMLTPGDWLATHNYWDGFFNPTYLPGLLFRTGVAAVLAGVFGLMTAQGVDGEEDRKRLSRFCSLWTILPLPVVVAAGWWQISVLSPEQQALALGRSPEVAAGMKVFWWALPCLLAGGALLAGGLPRRAARLVAAVTLAASFLFIGSFEYMREAARRPYLITGYIYSNGILVSQAGAISEKGALASAKWSKVKAVTPENRLEAGRELYYLQCASCHSIGGPMLDMPPRAAKYSPSGMEALLTGLGKIGAYMPPFLGTPAEKKALAAYLTEGLFPGALKQGAEPIRQLTEHIPAFDGDSKYVLTAVADRGVNMLFDADGLIRLASGTQGLTAHLVKRGPSPSLVTKDVTVTYAIEGQAAGSMRPEGRAFRADGVPVSPYPTYGGFQPYPVAVVSATDAAGAVLAETRVVLPVSSEMGCKNCHGGAWAREVAGIAPSTARDILKSHDRHNLTDLSGRKESVDCKSCHGGGGDPASGARRLNLPAAVHGLHAVYLAGRNGDACNMCHPTDPKGATRALRDPHAAAGFDCANCHGALEDHALSLLKREADLGAAAAKPLMALIKPRSGGEIAPREPWVNEPKCVTCHIGYKEPQSDQAFGIWTSGAKELFKSKRDDLDAMTCASCHGAAHAVYPAKNPYGKDRDNLQPLQYQNNAKALGGAKQCKACHVVDMDAAAHHPGMGVE